MKPVTRRSVMAGSAAAVTAIPVVGLCKDATEGGDAELRELWDQYLVQRDRANEAWRIANEVRKPYESDPENYPGCPGDLHKRLWAKHKCEGPWRAACREESKCRRIARSIRKAKAETLFGVGVKLSVAEGPDEQDIVEAAEDALRAISEITGFDFITATEGRVA